MARKVKIGNVIIGGGERVAIQSMSTYKLADTANAILSAERLYAAGCDILRFSVLDEKDALSIKELKKHVCIF